MTMDYKQFQEWLSGIDQLSPAFLGAPDTSASLAAVEASVGEEDGQCAHCGTAGAVSRGKARGLRRYQSKGCRRALSRMTWIKRLSGLRASILARSCAALTPSTVVGSARQDLIRP